MLNGKLANRCHGLQGLRGIQRFLFLFEAKVELVSVFAVRQVIIEIEVKSFLLHQ